ncbi:MAG: hypothetical protein ACLPSF_07595, partial [Methylocella sp.]
MRTKDFISLIRRDADDIATINKVLGCYASISERYRDLNDEAEVFKISDHVPRMQLPAAPFNEQELDAL